MPKKLSVEVGSAKLKLAHIAAVAAPRADHFIQLSPRIACMLGNFNVSVGIVGTPGYIYGMTVITGAAISKL